MDTHHANCRKAHGRCVRCSICGGHVAAGAQYLRDDSTLEVACRLVCAESVTGRGGRWRVVPPERAAA